MKTCDDTVSEVFRRREEILTEKKSRKKRITAAVSAAAGALVLALIGTAAVRLILPSADPQQPEVHRSEGMNYVMMEHPMDAGLAAEMGRLWPWDQSEVWEQYASLEYDGREYSVRNYYTGADPSVPAEAVGELLGSGKAAGQDRVSGTDHSLSCGVYALPGVDPVCMTAARIVPEGKTEADGVYLVYFNADAAQKAPADLGTLCSRYALRQYLPLDAYWIGNERYVLTDADSAAVWEILEGCAGAPLTGEEWEPLTAEKEKKVGFSATSRVLGLYNRSFSVSADGFLRTNIAEYGYCYAIGTDAAEKILKIAARGVREDEPRYGIVGVVCGQGPDYFILSGKDGRSYTVVCDTVTGRRALGTLTDGACCAVTFDGRLYDPDGDGRYDTVYGLYSADIAYLSDDGEVLIPE